MPVDLSFVLLVMYSVRNTKEKKRKKRITWKMRQHTRHISWGEKQQLQAGGKTDGNKRQVDKITDRQHTTQTGGINSSTGT